MLQQRTYQEALKQFQEIEQYEDRLNHWKGKIQPFIIRIVKRIEIRDQNRKCLDVLHPGDYLCATAINETSQYFVASPCGIYFHEAERVPAEPLPEVAILGYN